MSYTYPDILIRLIAAHAIADFILQPTSWVKERKRKKIRSKYLYLHTLITAVLTWLAFGAWFPVWVPLVIASTHFVLDLAKSYLKKDNLTTFLVDQGLHILIITICWLIYTQQFSLLFSNLSSLSNNNEMWVIVTAYILVTIPSSVLIMKLTSQWESMVIREKQDSLKDAGKWIGILERVLVLTFTLIGKYEAIGFLLAAKSVFRFSDLRDATDRKRTEYILIGTLLSFSIAIILGMIAHRLL